jgi:hypothetical protein
MAEETVFFEEGNVKVTNARFLTFGKTHSMNGITSVTKYQITPSRKGPIIVAVIGLLAFIFKWYIAVIILAAAVAWFISQKKKYSVQLSSASGDNEALTSTNEEYIDKVVAALNDAIVHRG